MAIHGTSTPATEPFAWQNHAAKAAFVKMDDVLVRVPSVTLVKGTEIVRQTISAGATRITIMCPWSAYPYPIVATMTL